MYKQLKTTVLEITYEDYDIQKVITDKGARRAILYKQMTPPAKVGNVLLVNTTATELQLGTGGWDIVCSLLEENDWISEESKGHIIKARYTPIQHSVMAVEAQESPYHEHFTKSFSLLGKPVWLAELHSMVPLFYYVSQQLRAQSRCCVIFDDQASLPLKLSDQLRELEKEEGFYSITVGQAFGGQFEAITVASALQFAENVLQADFILISVGPGVVGTGTCYGFSGMVLSNWSHTVSALGGTPVWIPRLSFAESRKRHLGISHHTLTPLSQFTFRPAMLPFPYLNDLQRQTVEEQLESSRPFQTDHRIHFAKDRVSNLIESALKRTAIPIQTMGRKYEADPLFFCAVAEAVRFGLDCEPFE
ncbi:DUF3866 family protein [Halalkalibacter kiskunsagensis]|uniref:DUF3866 family protein n=1 Tax=Halalkalibacter kiskunsagensis TaxID=1548599 RepID=A0ABV6KJ68_9BACI